jgi:hypothetical protein
MRPNAPDQPSSPLAPPAEGEDLEALDRIGPVEGGARDPRTTKVSAAALVEPPPAPREEGPTLASTAVGPLPPQLEAALEFDDAGGAPCLLAKTVTVIGRVSSGADLVLPWNAEVSREHAAILFSQGRFFLEDLRSQNGTYVNERRIERVALRSGDRIRIGSQVLVFRVGG